MHRAALNLADVDPEPGRGIPLAGRIDNLEQTAGAYLGSGDLNVARLLALRAGRYIKGNALTFGQRTETVGLNCGKMREEIIAALFGGDEAETLRIIEPFDDTSSHVLKLRKNDGAEPRKKGRNQDGEVRIGGNGTAGLRELYQQDNYTNTTQNRCDGRYRAFRRIAN